MLNIQCSNNRMDLILCILYYISIGCFFDFRACCKEFSNLLYTKHNFFFFLFSIILHIEVCVRLFPCFKQEYNICTVHHAFSTHFPFDKRDLVLSFVQCTLQIMCYSNKNILTRFKSATQHLKEYGSSPKNESLQGVDEFLLQS